MKKYVDTFIDGQYRRPSGIVGRIIGNRMAQQHEPENNWTVSLLSIQLSDTILEIGFGSGTTIQRLATSAAEGHVAGVDFSRTMVRVAQKQNAKAIRAGRVELKYGDVINLPFDDSSFDKILSIHSLYFWPDPVKAFAEVIRVLKPGGMSVLTLLPKERWPGGGEGSTTCRVYSGEDVASMMTNAGFTSTRIEPGQPEYFREIAVIGVK
ncbi:MAG: class I SAM-dependent methyltransferase [Ktedonobacteraceae bacterium]